MPNSVHLHRVLAARPDKVYRAFLEADALAKWLPPNGFACTVHHLDAKVGGTHRMSFRNFTTGMSHSFGGEYVELVPGERLRYTDKFDDPNLPGEMQVTVTLKKVSVGTELDIAQAGVPDVIPPEACYLGWQQSLRNLARLVEPEIDQDGDARGLGSADWSVCYAAVAQATPAEKGTPMALPNLPPAGQQDAIPLPQNLQWQKI